MTNPYKELERNVRDNGWMIPQQEQIVGAEPGTMKAIMEVWRDTANQLNGTQAMLNQAREDNALLQSDLEREREETQAVKDLLKQREEYRKQTDREHGKEMGKADAHIDKLRRHRDELEEKVKGVRKVRTDLNKRIELWGKGVEPKQDAADMSKVIVNALNDALGDSDD